MTTVPKQIPAPYKAERRAVLSRDPVLGGLDYIEVKGKPDDHVVALLLHFVPSEAPGKASIPPDITPAMIDIRRGGVLALTILGVQYPSSAGDGSTNDTVLTVNVLAGEEEPFGHDAAYASSAYVLTLLTHSDLDPFFTSAPFFLSREAFLDPAGPPRGGPVPQTNIEIDYLAKDYESFRRLMLDQLALAYPSWTERHPADMGVMLVEVLAYAADYLSYYQDAVATEAYLATARLRTSVRRHARMLDYRMSEGCNARVWVQIQVSSDAVRVPRHTAVLTYLSGHDLRISPDVFNESETIRRCEGKVFETMHDAVLCRGHNVMPLYAWGLQVYGLKKGATRADLVGHHPHLQIGDVLIFEEVNSSETGRREQVRRYYRHAVRLIGRVLTRDQVRKKDITQVTWAQEDALPFDLQIAVRTPEGSFNQDVSIARGNIVMADFGKTISREDLPNVPATAPYHPQLQYRMLTYYVPYQHEVAVKTSAHDSLLQSPQDAVPAIVLHETSRERRSTVRHDLLDLQLLSGEQRLPGVDVREQGAVWHAQADLLNSDPRSCSFVVETETHGEIRLRFGDGKFGKEPLPSVRFRATYRIGNGMVGNIGPDTLVHIVTEDDRIIGVGNPLAAQGGTEPESQENVRLNAPHAFHTQERCVTEDDYAMVAERHTQVKQAVARKRWSGSWHTVFVYVDPAGELPATPTFLDTVQAFMENYRLAGYDLHVAGPRYVSLRLALTIYVAQDRFRKSIQQSLLQAFSNRKHTDGSTGFFYPGNFSFGQPVYRSRIVAQAMKVPGVVRVVIDQFQRWGPPHSASRTAETDRIDIGPLEIARLDNEAGAPESGTLTLTMEGGL